MVLPDSLQHQPVKPATSAFDRALPLEEQRYMWRLLGEWAGWIVLEHIEVFVHFFCPVHRHMLPGC